MEKLCFLAMALGGGHVMVVVLVYFAPAQLLEAVADWQRGW